VLQQAMYISVQVVSGRKEALIAMGNFYFLFSNTSPFFILSDNYHVPDKIRTFYVLTCKCLLFISTEVILDPYSLFFSLLNVCRQATYVTDTLEPNVEE
jgi:hypothetical protein